jgi:hypothetical protein
MLFRTRREDNNRKAGLISGERARGRSIYIMLPRKRQRVLCLGGSHPAFFKKPA